MLIPNYFTDTDCQQVNACPARAYFIRQNSRGESAQISLNGVWDFKYYASPLDLEETIHFSEQIPVPSCIQFHGYDRHQYTNTRYPFPYDPPYVPDENPCCVYERGYVHRAKPERRYFFNFEGVDSCFYLYINQVFVGYSQVSHASSEFEVTDFLCEGEKCHEAHQRPPKKWRPRAAESLRFFTRFGLCPRALKRFIQRTYLSCLRAALQGRAGTKRLCPSGF